MLKLIKDTFQAIKSDPLSSLYVLVALCFSIGTGISEGVAEGFFTLGGFAAFAFFVYLLAVYDVYKRYK